MSKPVPTTVSAAAASSSASTSSNPPTPTPWAVIARKGAEAARVGAEAARLEAEAARLEAERKANLRPASNAHRHVIECVLGFLSLAELAKATRVCPAWRNAAHHMRPIGAAVKLATALLQPHRKAELLRHVTTLSCKSFSSDSAPKPAQLVQLFSLMPQLRSVSCQVNVPCDPFAWPAKLTDLALHLDSSDEQVNTLLPETANDLLAALGQSSQALQRLRIQAWVPTLIGLDCGFLLQLNQLQSLEMDFYWQEGTLWKLDESQIQQLRQLTQLERLDVQRIRSASLRQLLRSPHQFKLASAPTFFSVDARAAECLASLPTLVELNAKLCSSATFLSKLPLLAMLQFDCHRSTVLVGGWLLTADAVVEGLSPCKALTSLTLIAPLQSSHMIALLPQLPLLRSVTLGGMSELESIRCFSTGPITSCLTSLTLRLCQHADLELNELGHLHALQNLETLQLFDSFSEALTEDDVANYTPPSRIFERLKQFRHYRSDYNTPMESAVEEESEEEDHRSGDGIAPHRTRR